MVKLVSPNSALELSYAHIGDIKYGEAVLCIAQGSWAENYEGAPIGQSGAFSFSFNRLENPVFATLNLVYDYYYSNYYLISNDGTHFDLNPAVYTDPYFSTLLHFSLENGNIIGANTGTGNEIVLNGTYTCTE